MLSRVAETLYWMARYMERAENSARLVLVNTNLLLDLPKSMAPGWDHLSVITGANEQFLEHYDDTSESNVLRFMLQDERNSSSLMSSLVYARANARTVRDIVLREAFEQVNEVYFYARDNINKGLSKSGRFDYLNEIIQGIQTFNGICEAAMNQDTGYQFLKLGRSIERADMTTRIIDVRSADLLPEHAALRPFNNIQWIGVLKSLTAYQMYRQAVQVQVRSTKVLEFLLCHPDFPRSIQFSINAIEHYCAKLPKAEDTQAAIDNLSTLIQQVRPELLRGDSLQAFIDDIQIALGELHQKLNDLYFLSAPEQKTA